VHEVRFHVDSQCDILERIAVSLLEDDSSRRGADSSSKGNRAFAEVDDAFPGLAGVSGSDDAVVPGRDRSSRYRDAEVTTVTESFRVRDGATRSVAAPTSSRDTVSAHRAPAARVRDGEMPPRDERGTFWCIL